MDNGSGDIHMVDGASDDTSSLGTSVQHELPGPPPSLVDEAEAQGAEAAADHDIVAQGAVAAANYDIMAQRAEAAAYYDREAQRVEDAASNEMEAHRTEAAASNEREAQHASAAAFHSRLVQLNASISHRELPRLAQAMESAMFHFGEAQIKLSAYFNESEARLATLEHFLEEEEDHDNPDDPVRAGRIQYEVTAYIDDHWEQLVAATNIDQRLACLHNYAEFHRVQAEFSEDPGYHKSQDLLARAVAFHESNYVTARIDTAREDTRQAELASNVEYHVRQFSLANSSAIDEYYRHLHLDALAHERISNLMDEARAMRAEAARLRAANAAQQQDMVVNTHGAIGPGVPAFFVYRGYYQECFDFARLNGKVGRAVSKIWYQDPFRAEWAIIAKAYTLARDVVGRTTADFGRFIRMAAPLMDLPSPEIYLQHLGWVATQRKNGYINLVQDPVKVEHAKFVRNEMVRSLPENHENEPAEFHLLQVCLDRGYLPGRKMLVLQRIAYQYSHPRGPAVIKEVVEREEAVAQAALHRTPTRRRGNRRQLRNRRRRNNRQRLQGQGPLAAAPRASADPVLAATSSARR
nr:putative mating-type 1-1-1 protein [Ceratocystis albifundus]WRK64962.1 putative mating-type 1-1-1 protein [Ceratocystis albifundus]